MLIVLSIYFTSCCYEIQCTNSGVVVRSIAFPQFTTDQIASIVIRRFNQNSNFQKPIDSLLINSANSVINSAVSDTPVVQLNFQIKYITPGYDFEIFVPSTNTLAKITNILQPPSQENACSYSEVPEHSSCSNPITSVTVNGVLQNYGGNQGGFYSTIFINQ